MSSLLQVICLLSYTDDDDCLRTLLPLFLVSGMPCRRLLDPGPPRLHEVDSDRISGPWFEFSYDYKPVLRPSLFLGCFLRLGRTSGSSHVKVETVYERSSPGCSSFHGSCETPTKTTESILLCFASTHSLLQGPEIRAESNSRNRGGPGSRSRR